YANEAITPCDIKPTEAPVPVPQHGLLMESLDQVGMAEFLTKFRINIFGYAQGGYMYDTTAPQPYAGPTFLTFNNLRNTPLLDKISLNAERTVDPSKMEFDLGFRLEGIWGYDARFIHSNGLGDTQTGRYQFDPLQMYVDVALPCLPAKIRAGKWLTLSGFEHFSANIYNAFGDPARALYSNSYQFFYAEPGTQSGILGTYVINPKLTAELGFTRGWNQSTRDGNSPYLDIVGRLTYVPDDKTAFVFVFTEGPEFPIGVGRGLPEGDKDRWWTYLNLVATRKIDDKLSLGMCIDFVTAPGIPGFDEGSKQWGGIAGYASYAVNQFATINSRIEWFNDSSDGYAMGTTTGANYFETTLGLAIKPFPKDKILSSLLIRPEIRYDGSNNRVFATGDNRPGEKGQLTLSGDLLFQF
ncbi:MAG TPA: outer membrane beta-barrel protein, partial [Candidatus Omnitrophota bacterium]|nr:outer membrane beta-barrel protein [Candidatus Omnitrophota bacterium]